MSASEFAVARSGLPSPFRSPIATESGPASRCVVALGLEAAVAAVQEHGDGVRVDEFAVARSGLPSPFRSPIATESGPLPVA